MRRMRIVTELIALAMEDIAVVKCGKLSSAVDCERQRTLGVGQIGLGGF